MSITSVEIALLICFAVLSTLTFTQGWIPLDVPQDETSKMFEADDADAGGSDHTEKTEARSANSVDPKDSFLAGEDTPVWLAYYENPNDKVLLTYKKLEKGIVKQAIEYWKSNEFKGISKEGRNVDGNMNQLKEDRGSFAEREAAKNVRSSVFHVLEQSKREVKGKVYHPSVLAIMEYGKTWPSDKKDERKLILERIIYALAYWNGVDVHLRPIENPWIRLRLAGIVIGRDRDDTHHLFESYGGKDYLHYEGTLYRMGEYWGDRMRQKVDFQRGTYNIVALMTDAAGYYEKTIIEGSFSDNLLCDPTNLGATGVLIINDNLEFSSLHQTVRVMILILSYNPDITVVCSYDSEWNSLPSNKCELDSIRKSLPRNAWCMERPMEFHNPGKPVETILPGMLTSLDRQCKAYGWSASALACTALSTCMSLWCQISQFDRCEDKKNPPIDGSTCGVGMICLNAVCRSKTVLTRS